MAETRPGGPLVEGRHYWERADGHFTNAIAAAGFVEPPVVRALAQLFELGIDRFRRTHAAAREHASTVFRVPPTRAHYIASKSAVIGLTRVLARELGARGVREAEDLSEAMTAMLSRLAAAQLATTNSLQAAQDFAANAAWTVIACLAHNLLRWTPFAAPGRGLDRALHPSALMRPIAVVLSWNGREDTLACLESLRGIETVCVQWKSPPPYGMISTLRTV